MLHSIIKAGSLGLLLCVSLLLNACDPSTDKTEPKEKETADKESAMPEDIHTLPGFEVQLLYSVPRESQGTWVAMTVDPKGRLIVSDQQNNGMYRITVSGDIEEPKVDVEKLIMPISGAQGLVWAFDHLYINVNGKGLFRMRDSNGDDQFDILEYLGGPRYRGEHGNHSIIRTADGEGLYVINGDETPPPDYTASRLSGWEEDLLLPRQWDARGIFRGLMAPGGTISRISPDASEWEIISIGYRNTYDAAINQRGELFTYDSDMEWDMGMPWYRPTRLVHVVSGSDYGWRAGSGKWPAYYEDSLPPILNIGPGSPTGLLFGTGADFPARYQHALFGLDWTFGTIYAFHLTPDGASYNATAEEFLYGSPLPLTDAVIGKDGNMYFITGGRDLESKLYRVVYTGPKSTEPAGPEDDYPKARAARELRHKLEAFHGHEDPQAIEVAWPHLDSKDRFIRYAARVAVEAQPVSTWAKKALTDERPQARITAMVALARTAPEKYREEAIDALMELDLANLTTTQQLGYLRAMALVFMRLGDPNEEAHKKIADTLLQLLPEKDSRVNTELVRLLVYLKEPGVIDEALALMQSQEKPEPPSWGNLLDRNSRYGGTIQDMIENPPPTVKLQYAFMLRNLSRGWSTDQLKQYFTFINEAADAMGGASYAGFLKRTRSELLSNLSKEQRKAVADITGKSLNQTPDFEVTPPEGPGREWTVEEAEEIVEGHLKDRNFLNGRNAFFALGCASCHRFDGYGGFIGPDLGMVGTRFSTEGILEAIIKPSAMISSQYASSKVTLKNGDTLVGQVIKRDEYIQVYGSNPDAPPTKVPFDEVATIKKVDVSQMPPGLINTLNPEELRDLIAYLKSGGNPEDDMFGKKSE